MVDYFFKPRANLLLQLGDQLIKNENIAIVELIKNAYDADSTKVEIILNDIDKALFGEINIIDNGIGMSMETIKNVWLEPGNPHKKLQLDNNAKTPKGRLPIGEKGIGRFGVHKLGKHIELITRAKNNKEIVVEIDWSKFDDAKYLNDVPVKILEREPSVFDNERTGTKIKITRLNATWNKDKYLELRRSIDHFNSPFESISDFEVVVTSNLEGWDEQRLTFDEIKDFALYHYESTINTEGIETFKYEFLPYKNMGLQGRVVSKRNKLSDANGESYYSGKEKIGNIKFKLFCFDRDSNIVNKYLTADKKQFKNYLDLNGGICVFRDGLRIYDYGEPENDWLGLDHARLNQPASKISNNIIIGAVFLDRRASTSLVEKSNREGFVENNAYKEFKNVILGSITNFLSYRNADKSRIRTNGNKKEEPIIEDVKILRQKIDLCDIDIKDKKEMIKTLNKIEKDYVQIKEIGLLTSSAGISYGIVIHEIEKIIKELKLKVNFESTTDDFRKTIYHLSDIIQNYSDLIRQKKKENVSLLEIVEQSKFNCLYRLRTHNIEMLIDSSIDSTVECSYNLIVGSLLNIIDNSIWWLHKYGIKDKKIYCKISNYKKGYTSLIIADNGLGFTINTDDAVKPFVTQKNGGIGLGLNIVNEVMIAHDGQLEFPSYEELEGIPEEFSNGAILSLCFKQEK